MTQQWFFSHQRIPSGKGDPLMLILDFLCLLIFNRFWLLVGWLHFILLYSTFLLNILMLINEWATQTPRNSSVGASSNRSSVTADITLWWLLYDRKHTCVFYASGWITDVSCWAFFLCTRAKKPDLSLTAEWALALSVHPITGLRCVCHPSLHISNRHKQPNHILSSTWVPPNVISLHNWIGTRRLLVCALIWIVPLTADIVFKDSPVNTSVFSRR